MNLKILTMLLASFFLTSCATEQKPPEKKWEVKVKTLGEPKIWVWKSDGSKQCQEPAKFTPEDAAEQLRTLGVLVYQSRKGTDGLMHASVCGGATGATVELEIGRVDYQKAVSLGFRSKPE